jgi:predicted MFS family arabinose efflux permease
MIHWFYTLRQFSRDVRLYLLAWALIGFGYFGIQGVLFNLYLLRLGYGPEFVGLFNGSGLLVWALFAVPAGAIGARFGVRASMIGGLALSTIANGLLLFAESIPAEMQASWLIGWWLFRWLGTALIVVNSTPYLTCITSSQERKHAFPLQQAVMALMGFVGSLVAGILPTLTSTYLGLAPDGTGPLRYVLCLTPVTYTLAVVALLSTRKVIPVDSQEPVRTASPMPVGLLVFVGLVVFLQMVGEGTIRAFFNVYLDTNLHVSTTYIAMLMGVGQLLPMFAALAAPLIMARWSAGYALSAAIFGMAFCLFLLAFVPNWVGASLAFLGVSAMAAITGPVRTIFSQEAVSSQWRTAMSVATTMGLALGLSAAAWTGGYMISSLGYSSLFSIAAALSAGAAFLLLGYFRWRSAGKPARSAVASLTAA